jgi:uncharacterized membrane protein
MIRLILNFFILLIIPGVFFIYITYFISSILIKYESKYVKKISFWLLELIKLGIYFIYFILYFLCISKLPNSSVALTFVIISLFIGYYQKIISLYFKIQYSFYKRVEYIGSFRNTMLMFLLIMLISVYSNIYLFEPLKKLKPDDAINVIWITVLVDQIVVSFNLNYKNYLNK